MNFDLDANLRSLLTTGERLLWTGRPRGGIALRPSDALAIPFSLFWFGFAIFWTYGASRAGGLFGLFGVPFLLIGFYIAIGRFVADAIKRRKTVYGITDSRVIILSGFFDQSLKSLPLKTLPEINLRQKADGSGTISFGATDAFSNPGGQPFFFRLQHSTRSGDD